MKFSTLHKKWMKDPEYWREYDALEEEFALMAEVAKARLRTGLSHPQLMRRMKTTRRTMTRLENGRDVLIQTLSRFAKATGHRLKISFEPVKVKKGSRGGDKRRGHGACRALARRTRRGQGESGANDPLQTLGCWLKV